MPGIGANYSVIVVVDEGASNGSAAMLSYGAPVISRIDGDGAANAPGRGGSIVRLIGSNFGATDSNASITAWASPTSNATMQFFGNNCTITISHVEIECTTAPGVGASLTWALVVEGVSNAVPLSSYAAPVVEAVSFADTGVSQAATTGGTRMRIIGRNFGPIQTVISVTVAIGSADESAASQPTERPATNCILVRADEEVVCELPAGTGVVVAVTITVLGQSGRGTLTGDRILPYAPPAVTSITPAALPTQPAGTAVSVFGSGFGTDASVISAQLDGNATCNGTGVAVVVNVTFVVVRSDGELTFNFPSSMSPIAIVPLWNLRLSVSGQAPRQYGDVVEIKTQAPVISVMTVKSVVGSVITVIITGSNFGPGPMVASACREAPDVQVDGIPCLTVTLTVVSSDSVM